MSRVRETHCCNVIFVRQKAIQVHPRSPGKGKTPTGAYKSNLAHLKKARRVKYRRNLRGGRFGFRKKKDDRFVDPNEHPQCANCRGF
jgi:hypothetical protein